MTRANDTTALRHLITNQDLDAFVDGELSPERRAAAADHLARRPAKARRAADDLHAKLALRAASDIVYAADPALAADVRALLARRVEGETTELPMAANA